MKCQIKIVGIDIDILNLVFWKDNESGKLLMTLIWWRKQKQTTWDCAVEKIKIMRKLYAILRAKFELLESKRVMTINISQEAEVGQRRKKQDSL